MVIGINMGKGNSMKEYLDAIAKDGKLSANMAKSAVDIAQDIIYEAWETEGSSGSCQAGALTLRLCSV